MTTEPRAHAILSPSFMHIALPCPASVGLKEKLPPSPKTAASSKGDTIHDLGKTLLNNLLLFKSTGKVVDEKTVGYAEGVYETSEAWRDIVWKELFQESITGKAWGIEDKLTYSEKFSLWGTADVWVIGTDERAKRYAHIGDLKTGHVYVEEQSPQLAAYAVALRKEIRDLGKDLDYVKCSIYQPFGGGEVWRTVKYSSKQLDKWETKFIALAEKVFSGAAKFKAGDHCQYCPGQAHCEVYGKTLSKRTTLALIDPKILVFPDPAGLPKEVLSNIALSEKPLKAFIKACKNLVLQKLSEGEEFTTVKAVEGRGKRKMNEERSEELAKKLMPFGLTPFIPKLKGISALETDLKTFMKPKEAKELIDEYTIQNGNPISLVPIDDPRPAITSKIDLFINYENQESDE